MVMMAKSSIFLPYSAVFSIGDHYHSLLCASIVIDCGPLEDPADGVVQFSTTTIGSGATYDCFGGFTLVGEATRTCIEPGVWSDKAPTCVRKWQSHES